jgi:hypothetical protein
MEDPWATKPDNGKWIETGPHIMVTGATGMLSVHPKTAADPTNTNPHKEGLSKDRLGAD